MREFITKDNFLSIYHFILVLFSSMKCSSMIPRKDWYFGNLNKIPNTQMALKSRKLKIPNTQWLLNIKIPNTHMDFIKKFLIPKWLLNRKIPNTHMAFKSKKFLITK